MSRKDNNPALFVSLRKLHDQLGIIGVERKLRKLGCERQNQRMHPHKFRKTMATNAIYREMEIEQA